MIPTVDDQVTPQIAKKEAQRKRAQQAAQAAEVQKRREGGDLPKDLFAAPTRAVSKLACHLGFILKYLLLTMSLYFWSSPVYL